jgi:universal stress protein A
MSEYRRVLVAIDLSDASPHVLEQALRVGRGFDAELHLLHVVEYIPVEPMGEALLPAVDIEQELAEGARRRLQELADAAGAGELQRQVVTGSIKSEVVRVARELDADLIILGSKERHGLGVMVNLTEDTILHAAPCDVLAVRILR